MVFKQLTKEEAREEVKKLVKEFSAYTKEEQESKSENQIKSEFIDQLFEALGWDMRKDAEREERVLKGRADYILRLGNQKVLVIEAKKTNVKLTEEEGRQAVSYAYHNRIKFAVLTNFKQIRIYHALSNIKNIDRNILLDNKGGLIINCENFEEQFDRLLLLSKESFEKREINKLLSAKDQRQAKTVDESLLGDLLKIREWLSKEIKSKKNYLEKEKIDEIVQILIDRLIFIRSVEDRGLEPKDFLLNLDDDVRNQKVNYQLFPYLKEKFKEFNKRYDSKLFEDGLLDKEGAFSDEVLHKVIKGLYFGTEDISRERYMFDQIPCDLLGSIYEQYLGHILKGTEKRIKLESGHGKRKSMGIYYTPPYIVDYIVKNTVGEYIKNKTVDEMLLVKILDPACGSGSFLVRAFEEVCNIVEDKLRNGKFSVERAAFKDYSNRLSLHQKITILTNCIYGVDLDEKAVELARLNLLLKLLENEGHETKKLLLPHLENNIKCGNSLIDDVRVSGKAFNWKAQFPDVFNQGGFDVVIGNPPYIRNTELTDRDKEFFNGKYKSAYKQYDIFLLFFEIGLQFLKQNGFLGFITSNKFIASDYGQKLRALILEESTIELLIDVSSLRVFKDASTYPVIAVLKKEESKGERNRNRIEFKEIKEEKDLCHYDFIKIEQSNFFGKNDNRFIADVGNPKFEIIKKIEDESSKISDLFLCQRGSPKNKIKITNKKTKEALPCILSKDIGKYYPKLSDKVFVVSNLQNKIIGKAKILLPRTVLTLRAAYDNGNCFVMDRIYFLISKEKSKINLKFVTAILNSKLIDFYYKINFSTTHVGGGYLDLRGSQIIQFPIRLPTPSQEKKITDLVSQMLSLQQKYHSLSLPGNEKERLEQQIKNVDYEIDEEVYKLYGITEKEKKIIEESLK
jgi:predicted type IV restriction endonuclease